MTQDLWACYHFWILLRHWFEAAIATATLHLFLGPNYVIEKREEFNSIAKIYYFHNHAVIKSKASSYKY